MRGITEERLKEVFSKLYWSRNDEKELFNALLSECTDLNAWQPIETAPHDRPILAIVEVDYGIEIGTEYHEIQWIGKRWSCHPSIPTHWQELPEEPK